MSNPPPPPNIWQQVATQLVFVQTPFGPAYYNPHDGSLTSAFIPGAAIYPQSARLQQPPPPPPATAPIAPSIATATAAPAPPPPTITAVKQSTFVPSDEMVNALEALSQDKWRMTTNLRSHQARAIGTLHECTACDGIILNVDVTGGGKSHAMRLSIAYEGAIGILTIPLLALTASIQTKMEDFDPSHGPVLVVHLDEHCTGDKSRKDLIGLLNRVKKDTTRTIIVLTSPQYISDNSDFQQCLLHCRDRGTLRSFQFDEVHLFCLHGVGFRDCILKLGKFLRRLFKGPLRPYIMACTATWSIECNEFFEQITGINLRPENVVWAPIKNFRRRQIHLKALFTEEPTRHGGSTVTVVDDMNEFSE